MKKYLILRWSTASTGVKYYPPRARSVLVNARRTGGPEVLQLGRSVPVPLRAHVHFRLSGSMSGISKEELTCYIEIMKNLELTKLGRR